MLKAICYKLRKNSKFLKKYCEQYLQMEIKYLNFQVNNFFKIDQISHKYYQKLCFDSSDVTLLGTTHMLMN